MLGNFVESLEAFNEAPKFCLATFCSAIHTCNSSLNSGPFLMCISHSDLCDLRLEAIRNGDCNWGMSCSVDPDRIGPRAVSGHSSIITFDVHGFNPS